MNLKYIEKKKFYLTCFYIFCLYIKQYFDFANFFQKISFFESYNQKTIVILEKNRVKINKI